jgi:hypothetical protein
MLARGQAQLENGVFLSGLNLWGQHAGSSTPRLALVPARLDHQDLTAAEGDLPGAGCSYGTAANNNDVMCGHGYETI